MITQYRNDGTPNFSVPGTARTIGSYHVQYAGELSMQPSGVDEFSQKKLDHNVSRLADASPKLPPMNLLKVIHRVRNGEFGSTEVPQNQIW